MTRVRNRIIIILLIFPIFVSARNTTGTLQGYVTDVDGRAISNLHVVVLNTPLGDVTDDQGFYIIENIPIGSYDIQFDHISYTTRILQDVNISTAQTTTLGTVRLDMRILRLNGLVVTATRSTRRIIDVPQALNVIPARRIQERNAKTSAEVLHEEAGVFVQKTNHGGGSAIIRGLSSNQILLMVDGVRLNNSTYRLGNHQYLTTIDNAMLDRLEVVRGPTSVLYGSDALGGTINAVTKRPTLDSDRFSFDYKLQSRYATADQEKNLRSEFTIQNRKLAVQAGFSYKNFGDLRRGGNSHHQQLESAVDGIQHPTAFAAHDLDAKLVYALSSSQTLIIAHQASRQREVPRYDKYEYNDYHRWIYQPQKRDLTYLTYENEIGSRWLSSARLSLSYHNQTEGRETQKTSESSLFRERDDVNTLGCALQLVTVFDGHHLTYGADLYFDRIQSVRSQREFNAVDFVDDSQGRYPDGSRYYSLGLFLQNEIRLAPKWRTVAGLRYSHFSARFSLPDQQIFKNVNQTFHALTGSLGIIYNILDHVYLNTNIAQGFRAPNLSDISKLGESKGETYEVPNTGLEPEKMLSIDIGIKIDAANLRAGASVFYAQISDLLASADALYNGSPQIEIDGTLYKVKSKQNIGKAFIRGIEAEFQARIFAALWLRANIASPYGQNTTLDEPVGGIPPTFGLAGLRWTQEKITLDAYTRFAAKQDRLSTDDLDDPRIPVGGTPGWATLNCRGSIRLWDRLTVQMALENILDLNYREHGSGVNGPGRNFIISMIVNN